MKTLNKTLSLVLVLVMVLGLFGVAGAAFTDQKDVKYGEAVEVMTGIGAINGYTDGTIKPTGTITREEAAKLIVYSILGKSVAEKLTIGATGFSDVDAARWSAPYISYLVGEKVIAGMGDGTFAPTANVTGYQFAKMMLCANGYGAKGEFTGAGWELAVAVAAGKAKVFAGATGVDYTKPATREQAMLYAFNGIQVAQVSYNKLFDQYDYVTTKVDGKDVNVSIKDEVYPKLIKSGLVVDGVTSYRWMYKGQFISGAYEDATVLATAKNGTDLDKLTTASKAEYIGYQAGDKVAYYLNGVESTRELVKPEVAKRGVIVKFIDEGSDSKYDTVSVTVDRIAEVTGSTITKTVGATTLITVPGVFTNIDSKNVVGNYTYAKGDYVMVHANADNSVYYLNGACEKFTGTLNAFNEAGEVLVIDGTQYKLSGITGHDAIADIGKYIGEAGTTFYKDAAGFIVKAVPTNATVDLKNVVLVLDTNNAGYAVQSMVVFPNGTVTALPIAKLDTTTMTVATMGEIKDDTFYTFTKNENGSYNLKGIDAKYQKVVGGATAYEADKTVFTQGAANFLSDKAGNAITTIRGTATTQFVINTKVGKYSAYTGVSNIPTVTTKTPGTALADIRAAVLTDKDGYALFAVAYDNNGNVAFDLDVAGVKADAKYVFAYLPGTALQDTKLGVNYYKFYAVVNGELTTIDATSTQDTAFGKNLTLGMLTTVDTYENGRVDSTNDMGGYIDRATFAKMDGSAADKFATGFKVNGTTVTAYKGDGVLDSFIVDENCKFFIYDVTNTKDPKLTASSKDELALLNGYNEAYALQGVKKSDTNNAIVQLYVTKIDATAAIEKPADTNVVLQNAAKTSIVDALLADAKVDYYVEAAADAGIVAKRTAVNNALLAKGATAITWAADGKVSFTVGGIAYTSAAAVTYTRVYKLTVGTTVSYYAVGTDNVSVAKATGDIGIGYIATANNVTSYAAYGDYSMTAYDTVIEKGYVSVAVPTVVSNVTYKFADKAPVAYAKANADLKVTVEVAAAASTGTVALTATGATSVANPTDVAFTGGTAENFTFTVKVAEVAVTAVTAAIS